MLKNMTNAHRMGGKLDDTWRGSYTISSVIGKGRYQLKSKDGKVLKKLYNGILLKSYLTYSLPSYSSSQMSSSALQQPPLELIPDQPPLPVPTQEQPSLPVLTPDQPCPVLEQSCLPVISPEQPLLVPTPIQSSPPRKKFRPNGKVLFVLCC